MRGSYVMVGSGSGEQVIPAALQHIGISSSFSREHTTIGSASWATMSFGYYFDIAIHAQRRLLIWFLGAGRFQIHEAVRSLHFYTLFVLFVTSFIPDLVT